MDPERNRQKDNPFFRWALSFAPPGSMVYLPDQKVAPAILKKWGLSLNDFAFKLWERDQFRTNPIEETVRALVYYWSNARNEYHAPTKTVTVESITLNVVSEYIPSEHGTKFRFVRGWVGSPELTTLLLRTIRQNGGNEENPFNVLNTETVINYNVFLPDISFLPELYEELGVSDFSKVDLIGTGDWRNVWRGITVGSGTVVNVKNMSIGFTYPEKGQLITETISMLWRASSGGSLIAIYYIAKLPTIVIERLKLVLAQRKGSVPSSNWTKDTFQAMTKNLRGKDLVSLCLSDTNFGKLCQANDQVLFRRKLMEEFGVNWDENDHDFESPFLLYKQMHTFFEYVRIEIPAEDPGERNTYAVDYFLAKAQRPQGLFPVADRLVTLVPPVDAERTVMRKNFAMIVFFPAIPELSYYVLINRVFGENNRQTFQVVNVFETKTLRRYLDKEEIMIFTKSLFEAYWRNEDQPDYEGVDLSWYSELSGDDEIIVLESKF